MQRNGSQQSHAGNRFKKRIFSSKPPRRGASRFATKGNVHHSKFVQKAQTKEETVAYAHKHTFADFKIDEKIKRNISQKGYEIPTPIQDQTISLALENKDIVGLANTGTGKTGAFLIPFLDFAIKNPRTKVLILAPTRELAQQINQEFQVFAKNLNITSILTVGGTDIGVQMRSLRRPFQFVIGTPGRILDLAEKRRMLRLSEFSKIVLDEADRMLDMGFLDDMKFILSQIAPNSQKLFFSATMPTQIKGLIESFMNEPQTISVVQRQTSANVDQDVVRVERGASKVGALEAILKKPEMKKVLIFCRTKNGVERLGKMLQASGFNAVSIHGDKTQRARFIAIQNFKEARANILVATDVVARGLDIPNVSHVINFDEPANYDDYIHRIGRTGRGTSKGHALTFVESSSRY